MFIQLLAIERTPGAWLSARGQGPGWRVETDEADGRRRDDRGGAARAGAVRAGGGRQRGPQPAGVEQVRGLRARTELAMGWGQPVRGCESAAVGCDRLRGRYPAGAAVRAVRHSGGEHALCGGAVEAGGQAGHVQLPPPAG